MPASPVPSLSAFENKMGLSGHLWEHLRIRVPFDKSAYLLILMLISVNFFHFTPVSAITTNDNCLILFLGWLIAGHFMYNTRDKYYTLTIRPYYWPLLLVWGGVFVSFFAVKALYGQTFLTSFIASRTLVAFLALPVIGLVNPTMKDIEKAMVVFSIILLAFSIMDAVGIPVLDRMAYTDPDNPKELIDEDSFIMYLPGFHCLPIALFFFLDRLKKDGFNMRDFAWSFFFMAGIFLLQNRTILFASALIFAYVFLSIKGEDRRQTVFFRIGAVALLIGLVAFTLPQWIKLFTQTFTELGDDDYNRILAYNYFLFDACPSFVYYLTGTGFISANTTSLMQDLMAEGIYNSDVGFVGLWNFYGVLPIIAFVILIVKGLGRSKPYFVKFNAVLILVGSVTIACFNTMDKILWPCFYIFMLYNTTGERQS